MKRLLNAVALAVVVALAPAACAEEPKAVVSDEIPTDQAFIAKALAADTEEIQLAEKAKDKAANERVRTVAEHMLNDHSQARGELMGIVKDLKIGIATGETPEFKQLLFELTRAEGAEFDRLYINHMVQDHEKAVQLFDRYAKEGKNERLREHAQKSLPKIRAHLKTAREIARDLNK